MTIAGHGNCLESWISAKNVICPRQKNILHHKKSLHRFTKADSLLRKIACFGRKIVN